MYFRFLCFKGLLAGAVVEEIFPIGGSVLMRGLSLGESWNTVLRLNLKQKAYMIIQRQHFVIMRLLRAFLRVHAHLCCLLL